ncbi:MAG: EAL domain-containing protein [Burkholderiales bacterium]|jgi:diguanylate cyclase (GGDEF)-like protein/PAS domain S-box-containing protein|nr:EAL domain-containing protein [Burkholderiales bacterium]
MLVAVAAAYWAFGRVGLAYGVYHGGASPVWPAAGIAMAAMLLGGPEMLVAIFVGAWLNMLSSGQPPIASIWPGCAAVAEAATGWLLLSRHCDYRGGFRRIRDVFALTATAVVAPIVGSLFGNVGLALTGAVPDGRFFDALLVWWSGDLLGISLVTPVIVSWTRDERLVRTRRDRLELATVVASGAIVVPLALVASADARVQIALLSLALPLLVIAVLRFGQRVGGLMATGVVVACVVATVRRSGDSGGEMWENLALLDAPLVMYLLTLQILGAANAQRQDAEKALHDSEQRWRALARNSADLVLVLDADGIVRYASPSSIRILGVTPSMLEQHRFFDRVHSDDRPALETAFRDALQAPEARFEREARVLRDGRTWVVLQTIGDNLLEDAAIGGVLLTSRDITARREAELRVEQLATRDALTGLPNRLLLTDRLHRNLFNASRHADRFAVMFIDLDHFKAINDTLGHDAGDDLLKQVAERLTACVRRGDTVARLGGDEFVVMLERIVDDADVAQVAEKMVAELTRPFDISGHSLVTSCSIGVALYPGDGLDAGALLKSADTAMYQAKAQGRGRYRFFSAEMTTRAMEQMTLGNDLRVAVSRSEFVLHWQPVHSLGDGSLVLAEALLRWKHPRLGVLAPGRFVGLADDSGQIVEIGEWVLREACRVGAAWARIGTQPPRIGVNVSMRQLDDPAAMVAAIARALDSSGLPPASLEIEITESLFADGLARRAETLARIAQLGVTIAIDDFGTGFSNLVQLKRLPVSTLKLDRAIVRDVARDADSAAIVGAVVSAARHLGWRTVAEGIEDAEQLAHVRAIGCDLGQGFLLGAAQSAVQFEATHLGRRGIDRAHARLFSGAGVTPPLL